MNKTKRKGRSFRIERSPGTDQLRLFSYLFFNFTQRVDDMRRQTYENDLDLALISEAIGLSAIEPLMRHNDLRDRFRSIKTIVGPDGQRGVNALSISDATRIPRETVRRKIKKLIKLGAIAESAPGEYIMKPGFLQRPENLARLEQGVADTLHFINTCLELGILNVAQPLTVAQEKRA